MKATLVNKYNTVSKTTGNLVRMYVYQINSATADEIAEFQLIQGINYREEDGVPLFFTTSFEGNYVDLVKGKRKDPATGVLTEAFRAISSEDFELKRSILTAPARTATVPVINRATAGKVEITNPDF